MHAFVPACLLLGCTESKPAVPQRCTVRATSKGFFANGDPKARDQALASCRRGPEAVVIVEDSRSQAISTSMNTTRASTHRAYFVTPFGSSNQ